MNTIKFSFDDQKFQSKPSSDEIWQISSSFARSGGVLTLEAFMKIILRIDNGRSFS